MPRSLKSMLFEVSMIMIMMSVVGHLSVHFWENYVVKNELTQIKQSLHALKNTLLKIGNAYDILQMDIKGLTDISAKKSLVRTGRDCKKFMNTLDRRRLHDLEVNAMIDTKHAYDNLLDKSLDSLLASNSHFKVNNMEVNAPIYTDKDVKQEESFDFYPFKKREVQNIDFEAPTGLKPVKAPAPAKFNAATTTKNLEKSVGAGSFRTKDRNYH